MLTPKQKQILEYLKKCLKKNGYSPSLEEIGRHFKLAKSTIHKHIKNLKEKGYLNKIDYQARAIELPKNKPFSELIEIPLLGTITAGQPIEAIEDKGTIKVQQSLLSKSGEHFALRVQGDSMIEDGISNGDTVIIRKQPTAENGETAVAVLNGNEVTLKKIFKEKNGFRLQPANSSLKPIFAKELEIQGKVVSVIRKFEDFKKKIILDKNGHSDNNIKKNGIFLDTGFDLNNIYNIDCIDLMKKIKDNSVDLIFSDPPYNLSKSNFKIKFAKSGGSDLNTNKGKWDYFKNDDYEAFTKKWLEESFRILKENGSIWVAGSYHNIYIAGYIMQKIGFEILNEVLWHKSDATPNMSCTRFVADHENFIWARKGKKHIFNYSIMKNLNEGKQMRSIWTKGKTAGGKRMHPTQKPEWLLDRIIIATSVPQNIVFDPFMGSGTTAVVSKKLNRNFLGSETDKEYYKKSLERLKNINKCFTI